MADDNSTGSPSRPQSPLNDANPATASPAVQKETTMNTTDPDTLIEEETNLNNALPETGSDPLAGSDSTTAFSGVENQRPVSPHREEAKSRFSAAVEEAKAGAMALKAEATERASQYRGQAKMKQDELSADAKVRAEDARLKGKDLATEGKGKLAEGIRGLSRTVSDNAYVVDENLGAKYGDYARSASQSLADTAAKLDQKSIDELTEDGREFVRKSPGLAIGIAAGVGFMLSRVFGGRR